MPAIVNAADFGNELINNKTNLRRMMGTPRGVQMMQFLDSPLCNSIRDDFSKSTLSGEWTTATDAGATAFAQPAAASAILGGGITGSTGASANEAVAIHGKPNWAGDNNAGMWVTWSLDVVTSAVIEFGLVDPLTDHTNVSISDIDTPAITNGAVTMAMLSMDTAQTLTTMALVLDGDATYATSKILPADQGFSAFSPTAGTVYNTVFQTQGDMVRCATFTSAYVPVFDISTRAAAFEGGTQVLPLFFVKTLNTTPKVATLKRFWVWGDKP